MPHIRESIDFTVVAFVVYADRVLLIFHKQLKKWLPLGGHIELNENPEEALFREVKEESGLEIELLLTKKPQQVYAGRTFLYPPTYLDVHDIHETHKHIGMVYFAKANSDRATLAAEEHDDIKWFSESDLDDPKFGVQPDVVFYAREAFAAARSSS